MHAAAAAAAAKWDCTFEMPKNGLLLLAEEYGVPFYSRVVCIVSKEAHSIICSGRRRRNTPSTRNSTARRVQTREKETRNSTPDSKHRSKNTRAASKHLLSLQKKKNT